MDVWLYSIKTRIYPLVWSLRSIGLLDFTQTFYFEDYTEDELFRILKECLHKKNLRLSERAGIHLADYLHGLYSCRELDYANARIMKLIADAIAEPCWQRWGFSTEGMREVCRKMCADLYGRTFRECRRWDLSSLLKNIFANFLFLGYARKSGVYVKMPDFLILKKFANVWFFVFRGMICEKTGKMVFFWNCKRPIIREL